MVESIENNITDPEAIGFDAPLGFQPCWPLLDKLVRKKPSSKERIKGIWKNESPGKKIHIVYDYGYAYQAALARELPPCPRFPCVTPSSDNTARRKWGGNILEGSTPEIYGDWLSKAITRTEYMQLPEPLIFNLRLE